MLCCVHIFVLDQATELKTGDTAALPNRIVGAALVESGTHVTSLLQRLTPQEAMLHDFYLGCYGLVFLNIVDAVYFKEPSVIGVEAMAIGRRGRSLAVFTVLCFS